jgi:methylmalonyl-CoA carboxyltransferase large subunit
VGSQIVMIVFVIALLAACAVVWRKLRRLQTAVQQINARVAIRDATPAVNVAPLVSENSKPQVVVEPPVATSSAPVIAAADTDEVSTDLLLVISAAVAAFIGNKVHIRRVRLMNAEVSPWAQQGRAFIQASHNLSRT